MDHPRLRQRNGGAVEKAQIDSFKDDFRGQVILPGDADYDAARRIWNASVDKRPGLIARCSGTADVIRCVNFARANDLLVAVRGGGHNVAGRALCDDGIVIDLSSMNGIFVDPRLRTVRVQGGATLGDVDRETHVYGLAVPTGVVSRTGIAGLTLGGGVGWLVRKYGLTCDNLLSCEVVTAEGEVITASDVINGDLFWGLRGGGGNFGIVTSFQYKAYPLSTVLGGFIVHAREAAVRIFRHYRAFMASAPDEVTAYAGLISLPDGMPAMAVVACYCGDIDEGERVLEPLRRFGSPLLDTVAPMPFPAMQKLADASFPDGTYNYWRSSFVRSLSDDLIDVLVEHGNRAQSPLSGVMVEFYGGAVSRVGQGDTAFAQRQTEYNIGIAAQWVSAAESEKHIAWVNEVSAALKPYSSGGYLLNFLNDEGPAAVRAAFGSNYPRLVEVKSKYDPTNFFRLNQNVTPKR
jgi:hypothetical protein